MHFMWKHTHQKVWEHQLVAAIVSRRRQYFSLDQFRWSLKERIFLVLWRLLCTRFPNRMCCVFYVCVCVCWSIQNSNRSSAGTPPEASDPAPERRGPSYLSLSVNNSSSQRPLRAISGLSWHLSKIRKNKVNPGNSVRTSESLAEAWKVDLSRLWIVVSKLRFKHLGLNPSRTAALVVLMTG